MKRQLANYKKLERDLMRQIDQCNKYKQQIEHTLQTLQGQQEAGRIDSHTHRQQVSTYLQGKHPEHWFNMYDRHIDKCNQHLTHYRGRIQEIASYLNTRRNTFSTWLMVAAVIFLFLGAITFMDGEITDVPLVGMMVMEATEALHEEFIFEDGYTREGSHWMNIRGENVYERCLKVEAKKSFSSIKAVGKIMSATHEKTLVFKVYRNDVQSDTPGGLIDACKVTNYEAVWKSCMLNTGQQATGHYWICAANPKGDPTENYYSIAYQMGDDRQTALWTGQNWQKLNRASYTIRGHFAE